MPPSLAAIEVKINACPPCYFVGRLGERVTWTGVGGMS